MLLIPINNSLDFESISNIIHIIFDNIHANQISNKLQSFLPEGLNLTNSFSVPVSKKSLSQELKSATWSFNLSIESGEKLSLKKWQNGLNSISNANTLIWKDSDKKGRARERDFKQSLIKLSIEMNNSQKLPSMCFNTIRIKLESNIDNMGCNLKPLQIQQWVQNYFERTLIISEIRRDELKLFQC